MGKHSDAIPREPPVRSAPSNGGTCSANRPTAATRGHLSPRDWERGARALEAYPMIVPPGKEITWGELHVGSRQVFAEAGFTEVSHPSPRRVVIRVDFAS